MRELLYGKAGPELVPVVQIELDDEVPRLPADRGLEQGGNAHAALAQDFLEDEAAGREPTVDLAYLQFGAGPRAVLRDVNAGYLGFEVARMGIAVRDELCRPRPHARTGHGDGPPVRLPGLFLPIMGDASSPKIKPIAHNPPPRLQLVEGVLGVCGVQGHGGHFHAQGKQRHSGWK